MLGNNEHHPTATKLAAEPFMVKDFGGHETIGVREPCSATARVCKKSNVLAGAEE